MNASLASWRAKGQWFDYRGHKIFFITEGMGEPLVLLHGFPTSSWDWCKVWSRLSERFQLIALDFIGYGFSDKPRNYNYSLIDQADLVESLLAHLNIERFHVLAHDIGDSVSQELLARQSDRQSNNIISCCFLNGGLFPETHRPTRTQKFLLSPLGFLFGSLFNLKRFTDSFSMIFFQVPTPDELSQHFEGIVYNNGHRIAHKLIRYILERRVNRERWLAAMQKSICPLLLIDGISDPVSGMHMVKRYRELVPQSAVVEIPECGHYPQLEKPNEVLAAYLTQKSH